MKFSVGTEHFDFFRKHHAIELEELFSSQQVEQLNNAVEQTLQTRLAVRDIKKTSPLQQLRAGRDLWRDNQAIKKMITHSRLLEAVAQLTDQRILRLGYDQYFPSFTQPFSALEDPYPKFIDKQATIESVSSLQGIVAGVILCLKGQTELPQEDVASALQFFPAYLNQLVIFDSQALVDFHQLLQHPNSSYLMLTFTKPSAVYVYNEEDPNAEALRSVGYHLGDRLSDKKNPIVYRG